MDWNLDREKTNEKKTQSQQQSETPPPRHFINSIGSTSEYFLTSISFPPSPFLHSLILQYRLN